MILDVQKAENVTQRFFTYIHLGFPNKIYIYCVCFVLGSHSVCLIVCMSTFLHTCWNCLRAQCPTSKGLVYLSQTIMSFSLSKCNSQIRRWSCVLPKYELMQPHFFAAKKAPGLSSSPKSIHSAFCAHVPLAYFK